MSLQPYVSAMILIGQGEMTTFPVLNDGLGEPKSSSVRLDSAGVDTTQINYHVAGDMYYVHVNPSFYRNVKVNAANPHAVVQDDKKTFAVFFNWLEDSAKVVAVFYAP